MSTKSEVMIIILSFCAMLAVGVSLWVFQSTVERDVWNKCHPNHQLTLFETMWSTTRIDNCEVPE